MWEPQGSRTPQDTLQNLEHFNAEACSHQASCFSILGKDAGMVAGTYSSNLGLTLHWSEGVKAVVTIGELNEMPLETVTHGNLVLLMDFLNRP